MAHVSTKETPNRYKTSLANQPCWQTSSVAAFAQIKDRIIAELEKKPCNIRLLHDKLASVAKDKVTEVISFLVSEGKVEMNDSGEMALKNATLPAAASKA